LEGADKFVQDNRELLERYLERPSRDNILVILVEEIKGKKFPEKVRTAGRIIPLKAPYDNEMPGWIMSHSRKKYKRKMSMAAASLLFERLGSDLARIDSELEKLSLYVGKVDRIEPDDIRNAASEDRQFDWFALPDAIARRDAGAAHKILARLLVQGDKAPTIIGSVAWQLKRIWKAKNMLEAGENLPEIFRKFNLRYRGHQETLKRLMDQFSEEDLAAKYELLERADVQTKTGRLPERLALEILVAKLCME
jgi:DNA polymerase-3 subunit delta